MVSYIYIIGSDEPPYKIGISKNPEKRLKELQTGHPKKLKILSIKETEDSKTKLLESAIHYHMKLHRTHGEWFNVPLDIALAEIEFAIIRYQDDPLLKVRVKDKWFY